MPDLQDETPVRKRADRLSWAEIRRLALQHKKALWIANGVAVLATSSAFALLISAGLPWPKAMMRST